MGGARTDNASFRSETRSESGVDLHRNCDGRCMDKYDSTFLGASGFRVGRLGSKGHYGILYNCAFVGWVYNGSNSLDSCISIKNLVNLTKVCVFERSKKMVYNAVEKITPRITTNVVLLIAVASGL